MADVIFTGFKNQLLQAGINLNTTDTIKLALCTSSYTPNQDTHLTFNQVTNEVSNANYTAGGATLSTHSVAPDNTNHRSIFNCSVNVTWPNVTLTARYGVLYKSSGNNNTSPLICVFDFGADKTASGGTFEVDWNAVGICALT
jgi:hypothetical protein